MRLIPVSIALWIPLQIGCSKTSADFGTPYFELKVKYDAAGNYWNSYVDAEDTTIPCDPDHSTDCILAGSLREVMTAYASCSELSVSDRRSWFVWTCNDDSGVAIFDGVFDDASYGLEDLIDEKGWWLSNQLIVEHSSGSISKTSETIWWDDAIKTLDAGQSVHRLTEDHTVYLVPADTSLDISTILVGANGVSLLGLASSLLHMIADNQIYSTYSLPISYHLEDETDPCVTEVRVSDYDIGLTSAVSVVQSHFFYLSAAIDSEDLANEQLVELPECRQAMTIDQSSYTRIVDSEFSTQSVVSLTAFESTGLVSMQRSIIDNSVSGARFLGKSITIKDSEFHSLGGLVLRHRGDATVRNTSFSPHGSSSVGVVIFADKGGIATFSGIDIDCSDQAMGGYFFGALVTIDQFEASDCFFGLSVQDSHLQASNLRFNDVRYGVNFEGNLRHPTNQSDSTLSHVEVIKKGSTPGSSAFGLANANGLRLRGIEVDNYNNGVLGHFEGDAVVEGFLLEDFSMNKVTRAFHTTPQTRLANVLIREGKIFNCSYGFLFGPAHSSSHKHTGVNIHDVLISGCEYAMQMEGQDLSNQFGMRLGEITVVRSKLGFYLYKSNNAFIGNLLLADVLYPLTFAFNAANESMQVLAPSIAVIVNSDLGSSFNVCSMNWVHGTNTVTFGSLDPGEQKTFNNGATDCASYLAGGTPPTGFNIYFGTLDLMFEGYASRHFAPFDFLSSLIPYELANASPVPYVSCGRNGCGPFNATLPKSSAVLGIYGRFEANKSCPSSVDPNDLGNLASFGLVATNARFLIHARELDWDDPRHSGDKDGLCESNESCLFLPNIGAYQGHGLQGQCTFRDAVGSVQGVTMYGYVENGR